MLQHSIQCEESFILSTDPGTAGSESHQLGSPGTGVSFYPMRDAKPSLHPMNVRGTNYCGYSGDMDVMIDLASTLALLDLHTVLYLTVSQLARTR